LFEVVPELRDLFVKAEWYEFIFSFEGYHTGVAMKFAQTFDGFQTHLGDTCIHVTKHFIGQHVLSQSVGKGGLKMAR
jgi:hypothetical protein